MPRRCGGLPDGSAGLPRRYAPRNDNGGNLRVGFACLAWPGSALGQGPLRSALPVAASVILPSVTPLLAGFETDTEAKGVVAEARREVVAPGGAQVRLRVAPGATAHDPVRARCRPRGVGYRSCRVIRLVPVSRPFPNVAVHVEEAPRVRQVLPDVAGLVDSALVVICIRGGDAASPRIRRGRSRPAGVLPFR
ncbi:MAG: hypothetical protein OSB39_01440, partial [Opitutales bacterium]|nr:hypothetical protein [Opitutales bacterium]